MAEQSRPVLLLPSNTPERYRSFVERLLGLAGSATADTGDRAIGSDVDGGWFYRAADVPEPTTLSLLGLSLAGMGWMRRKRA